MTERECNWVFIQREGMIQEYCTDLNAIIGAVKDVILGDADLERAFIKHLNAILERRADDDAGPVVCEYEMAQITAEPREFCEAFLRTKGLWKNDPTTT